MITESIVKQTIELLEDLTDHMAAKVKFVTNADRLEMDQRLAEAHSLLNFWRLYLSLCPSGQSERSEQEDGVC